MTMPFPVLDMPTSDHFVAEYVARNTPVVIRGLEYDAERWTPEAVGADLGDLTALVYGSLFDLEDVHTLEEYLEDWFDLDEDVEDEVPYIRWYNKLRDVEFAWGDEALARVADRWKPPSCLPTEGFLVPVDGRTDPTTDHFPYRGFLVAAKGARTRLHRDPFFSDAVVSMFHGVKHAVMYRPERAAELSASQDGNSFGGFVDVRPDPFAPPTVEPDFEGSIGPGDMIYVPHGWLHDVVAMEDSLSVTWNFVHEAGSAEFRDYLANGPEGDSEFEILQYCHQVGGQQANISLEQIVARL